MAANDVIFREHGIGAGIAHADLLQNHDERAGLPAVEGQIAWMRDGFGGLRLFTFRKNVSASAFAAGDLASRLTENETNQTGTTATGSTGSWSGADEHIGSVFIVHDDTAGAGAAPEGEATIVASNTATVVTFESGLPLSTALASGDDVFLLSPKVVDAADGDHNIYVCGVAMSAVPDDDWGWFQFQGLHPRVQHKTTTTSVAGEAVVADAACVGPWGSDATILWVGRQVATHAASSDALQIKSPVIMTLLPTYV